MTDDFADSLVSFLSQRRAAVVDAAAAELLAPPPRRYALVGETEVRLRLELLLERLLEAVAGRDAAPFATYAGEVAARRHRGGYAPEDVGGAFAALERAIGAQLASAPDRTWGADAHRLVAAVSSTVARAAGRTFDRLSGFPEARPGSAPR